MADPRFLLDTNILVYLIAGKPEPLRLRVQQCRPGSLATSTICVAEAAFGLAGDVLAQRALEQLLTVIVPLPFDLAAALRFPDIPFRRGSSDRLIAAHALAMGLVLVTDNERDFVDVPALRIENWTRA